MKLVLWAAETAAETTAETAAEKAVTGTLAAAAEKAIGLVKANPVLAAGIAVGSVAVGWGSYALYKKLRS